MLLPFSTRQLADVFNKTLKKFDEADDTDGLCDPDVPLVVKINNKRYFVLSYGGDENEDGLVLEIKPATKGGAI
jgi:hypothetical protein